jgi:UDP-N-acetylglucosamine diphosphorylase/glucosamine-1-phosphate N-acetyltransferase
MHVVIFEGSTWGALAPLTFSRPACMLLSGGGTLLDKQLRTLAPTRLTMWIRPQLADYCRRYVLPSIKLSSLAQAPAINEPLDSSPAILVDGSTLCLSAPMFPKGSAADCWVAVNGQSNQIVQAKVVASGLASADVMDTSERWKALLNLPHTAPIGKPVQHLWDLLGFNEEALVNDAGVLRTRVEFSKSEDQAMSRFGPTSGVHLVERDQILIGEDVRLHAGCVIDASKGPVILSVGSIVGANAVVQGPCFIGEHSEILPLALIRPGTSIGPRCKFGGDVARAIVLGYSNKAHEGFLGDSVVGEWVNLGAGTMTSNLKNTYGSISMKMGDEEVDTGRRFLGSLIGDHTKTAIGTRFMSGSYVGYCSMIATSAHAPRFTPSFTFATDKGSEPYRQDKAVEVARAVTARRNRIFGAADEALMRYAAHVAGQVEAARTE